MNRLKMVKGWERALRKWNVKNPARQPARGVGTIPEVLEMEETQIRFAENKAARADFRTANLVGREFGRMLAWAATVVTRTASPVWLCLCGCGDYKEIAAHRLLNNHPTDCGCVKRERERIAKFRRKVAREEGF